MKSVFFQAAIGLKQISLCTCLFADQRSLLVFVLQV